jgi:glycosyltransferase involved in cell wall biosynthesis
MASTRLVYFSPVHWKSYEQRPHFMMRALLDSVVNEILWINPVPVRFPMLSDIRKVSKGIDNQHTPPEDSVKVFTLPSVPVEPLPLVRVVNDVLWHGLPDVIREFSGKHPFILGIGKPCRPAMKILDMFRADIIFSFYDAMDDFPEFYTGLARHFVRQWEKETVSLSDCIVASSTRLRDKFAGMGISPLLVRNACNISPDMPCYRQVTAHRQGPVIGYIGSIGKWFDWDIVVETARVNRECRIEIVGPVFNSPFMKLPDNIMLHPPCSYDESIEYMKGFDAGLIPFSVNRLTSGVDPVKYYEYRAMGLPVLSTRFGEMALRGRDDKVFFLDRGRCKEAVAEALSASCGADAKEIEKFILENNWKRRFEPFAEVVSRSCGL